MKMKMVRIWMIVMVVIDEEEEALNEDTSSTTTRINSADGFENDGWVINADDDEEKH